jgi:hypothetical protein
MAATKYTFSVSEDFPNQKVNADSLGQQIRSSDITTALDSISTDGDDCNIWFKNALATEEGATLGVIVGAHTGAAITGPPTTDEGVQYVTLLPGKSGRMLVIEGLQFDATPDGDTNGDLELAETREIQGAVVEVANHEKGDYVELQVVAPDGDPYNGAVVGQFANTVYIPPSGKIDPIVSESTVSFPAGFKFRLKYHAVAGGSTREVYVAFRMRHDA